MLFYWYNKAYFIFSVPVFFATNVKPISLQLGDLNLSSIYKFGLSGCLFVCLYPINVNQLNRSVPNFCGISRDLREGYEWSKFQQISPNQIGFALNFENPPNFFVFVLQCIQRENVHNWNTIWAKRPECPVI